MNQVELPDDDESLTASSISQISQSPFHSRIKARQGIANISPNMLYTSKNPLNNGSGGNYGATSL